MRALVVLVLSGCLGTLGDGDAPSAPPDPPAPDDPGPRYHPLTFAEPTEHGFELNQGVQDCRACHGDDLAGANDAPSCDSCHSASEPVAWRTQCTFCHGGVDDDTGAPPENLDGTTAAAVGVFPAHGKHVRAGIAVGFDCTQCHLKPLDVLSAGHVFDDTPGRAENDFSGGLSPDATWDGAGCANTYCHGDGRASGSVLLSAGAMSCQSCHPGPTTGEHDGHIGDGVSCGDCHFSVTSDGASIAAIELHVDGRWEIAFTAPGFAFDPLTRECTGACHGRTHIESW